ncbi:MAG TPA: hypothetical protein VJ842_02470 [Pyrinomonadaceae bacterium]|nr:hypothetical protein [Pyrinomonadaceae bacterium]
MTLTKTQRAFITKIRTAGASELGVALDDGICAYLIAVIAKDLELLQHFPELTGEITPFFSNQQLLSLRYNEADFEILFERLIGLQQDADTYFYCLATLHKARLKYERILQAQAIPTIDQVGPRGLLQFGSLSPTALVSFLFWRKWIFDIDNRAGQETGYVFEPIIAHAIGGVPFSAKKSPIKRGGSGSLGRQVDCIREQQAYEIKLRVTIAASGQGRWREELEFPNDCQASGFKPVLIVLDPTPNAKLEELRNTFLRASGQVYVGQEAWDHLKASAGTTMARFLELYVHLPIQSLLRSVPEYLPEIVLRMDKENLVVVIGEETLTVRRDFVSTEISEDADLPEDVDDHLPGL